MQPQPFLSHNASSGCHWLFTAALLALSINTAKALASASDGSPSPLGTSPVSLVVVERDLLQSRNMVPVINHATFVANISDNAVPLRIRSNVPAELDQLGIFWPRFGAESMLEMPILPSGDYPPLGSLERRILEKPEKIAGIPPGYEWEAVVPGKQSVVANYNNYFGPAGRLLVSPDKQQLFGLQILSRYKASQHDNEFVLKMEVEVSNASKNTIRDLQLKLCFPETIIDLKRGSYRRLFAKTSHAISGDASYSQIGHADGFGNRVSAGHSATLTAVELKPADTKKFALEMRGLRTEKAVDLFPAYLVGFREDEGNERIWPVSSISLAGMNANIERHYFREAALLIPAPWLFSVKKSSVSVVGALH